MVQTPEKYKVAVRLSTEVVYSLEAYSPEDAMDRLKLLNAANLIGANPWYYSSEGRLFSDEHNDGDVELVQSMNARYEFHEETEQEILWAEPPSVPDHMLGSPKTKIVTDAASALGLDSFDYSKDQAAFNEKLRKEL